MSMSATLRENVYECMCVVGDMCMGCRYACAYACVYVEAYVQIL